MYTLYITNKNYSSWSLRPWVLMRTLGIAFEERLVPLPEDDAAELFRSFSPSGRVPCLHDGDIVVWDSLAIVEYLAERLDGVWPTDARARALETLGGTDDADIVPHRATELIPVVGKYHAFVGVARCPVDPSR